MIRSRMKRALVVGVGVIALGLIAGIVFFGYTQGGNGILSIGITDAPSEDISHIYITISSIELQGRDNSTIAYSQGPIQFDLISLVNVTKMLGNVSIPAGNYTMIRFAVTSAVATLGGTNVTLKVPSDQVKVPLHFQIQPG